MIYRKVRLNENKGKGEPFLFYLNGRNANYGFEQKTKENLSGTY